MPDPSEVPEEPVPGRPPGHPATDLAAEVPLAFWDALVLVATRSGGFVPWQDRGILLDCCHTATCEAVSPPAGGRSGVWTVMRSEDMSREQLVAEVARLRRRLAELEAGGAGRLRDNERRFRLVAESTSDLVYEWDPASGRMTWYGDLAGMLKAAAPPETVHDFIAYIHPDDLPWVYAEQKRGFAAGESWSGDYRVIAADGEVRIWHGIGTAVHDERGDPRTIIGAIQDITERHRAAEERARLEQQLQQAQKMESIGRLAGGVAHDFNNLLTGITGYVTLAMMDLPVDDPLHATLAEIEKAAKRAARLTQQLLAFSRRQIIEPRVLDLNGLITELHNMLVRLIGEDIELTTIAQPRLGHIEADPVQVEQILINLVVNARDAMPAGGRLTIETADVELDADYCQTHPQAIPGPYVMLAVSDSGDGIEEDIRSLIFEPFFSTKDERQGTGLGLSTVYGIIKQHGGSIEVYSEPGAGTVFKVYFPLTREAAAPLERSAADTSLPRGDETVLVVEDEDIVRDTAVRILERQGYTVLPATSGPEALELIEQQQPEIDLLLTDIVMPRLNGRELAERIQARQPDIKVLYTSGYTENVLSPQGVLEPGVAFIGKPYQPVTLARKVRQVLDGGAD